MSHKKIIKLAKVNDKLPGEEGADEDGQYDDNLDNYYEEYRNDEEEVAWEDIDVKDLETQKVQFQSLPGMNKVIDTATAVRKESSEDDDGEMVLQKLMEKNNKVESKIIPESFTNFSDFKDLNLNIKHEVIKKEIKEEKFEIEDNIRKEEKVTYKTFDQNSLFSNDFTSFFTQSQVTVEKQVVQPEPKQESPIPRKEKIEPVKPQNLVVQNHGIELKTENTVHRTLTPEPKSFNNMPGNIMGPQQYYYVNPNHPKQNDNNFDRPSYESVGPMKGSFDPASFLENPSAIIQKNLVQRGWFLMSENNKILGNFNSLDLLIYLDDEFEAQSDMTKVWITDYETDIYFTPSNLYEALKDTVPKLIENIKSKKNQQSEPPRMNKGPFNPHMMPMNPKMMKNMPMHNNQMRGPPMGMMPMPMDRHMMMRNPHEDRMHRPMMNNPMLTPLNSQMMSQSHKSMSSQNMPPVNMNINLQFVKNDINLNNIVYPKEPPKQKKPSNLTNLFNSVSKDDSSKNASSGKPKK
jgi:hypothetical protein